MSNKKIHIIGSTGSGKSYLARMLSSQYKIPYFELDNVMWNDQVEFGGKNSPEIRDQLLEEILMGEQWIVEGVYYKWVARSFEEADVIIYLDHKRFQRAIRIISRFVKQRTGLERSNYKQTFKGLIEMLKWNHRFDKTNKIKIFEMLAAHKQKLIVCNSNKVLLKDPSRELIV
ncbi:DNA topology modulation protein FlaR [Paenibacillus mendelii]|uniref:DNA topology modulation protein FlaR n=1 Tax=Paenibacillus mendelii TaxID=206163 RepID=A0ABV6JB38_9BACL|nr:DNA topology modulation protein FlaR [Paenibacillus mendelii]MCQ6562997.1 DNA topology modulation protein FlaR [Paenibacillus mendelii]